MSLKFSQFTANNAPAITDSIVGYTTGANQRTTVSGLSAVVLAQAGVTYSGTSTFISNNVNIGTLVDNGYNLDVVGKTILRSASNIAALRLETANITGYTQSVMDVVLNASSTLFANMITCWNPNMSNTGKMYINIGTAQSNYNMVNIGFYKESTGSANNFGFLDSWGGSIALRWYWNGTVTVPNGNLLVGTNTSSGYKLQVVGTFLQTGNMTLQGTLTSNNTIQTGDGTVTVAMSYSASTAIIGTSSNHSVDFRTNNANSMRLVTSTNRLLINTTTDGGYVLRANGTSYFDNQVNVASHVVPATAGGSNLGSNGNYFLSLYCVAMYGPSVNDAIQLRGSTSNDGLMIHKISAAKGLAYFWDNATTVTTNNTVILGLQSTTRGFLLSRLTTAQRTAIVSPADGLMVYDTDLDCPCFYDGGTAAWKKLSFTNA